MNFISIIKWATTALFAVIILSGCTTAGSNSVESTLATTQPAPQQEASQTQTALAAEPVPSPAEQATGIQTGQNVEVASLDAANSMAFMPIEGAPQGKISALTSSIQRSAVDHGLSVLPSTLSGSAAYTVKGYFSALNDGSGTLLVYIWDVEDASGKFLHRINGQERSGQMKTDPWQAITDTDLTRVAENTATQLKNWIETKN